MYPVLKRIIDIFISVVALTLFLPFALFISFLIYLEDGGYPIYYHLRVGKNRKLFRFYKFRSMVTNADDILFNDPKFLELMRSGTHKLKDDPRVTKIGRFIRKYSIDEFPQFINVLLGDMSFVGPRPFRPDEIEKYEKSGDGVAERVGKILSVKPGITGLWQTGGRSNLTFEERIKLELSYVDRCSFVLDLCIILKTPLAVIQAKGAH